MTKQIEFYLSALRNAGHRITEPRYAICDYLAVTDQHPTPSQVYTEISARRPEISRATVYNTLKTLQQLGVIIELNLGADHMHYETDPSPHVNLICLRCHRVVDYAGELFNDVLQPTELTVFQQEIGFQPLASKIDVLGLCQACQQEEG